MDETEILDQYDQILDQYDYHYLTLMSLGNLTEKSAKLEFSVSEISNNMERGKSKNRVLYALFYLISEEYVNSSDYVKGYDDSKDISGLKQAMDADYYITKKGLEEYDTYIKSREHDEKVRTEQISPDLAIIIYIYKNMIGFLFSYPRMNVEKFDIDQKEALDDLIARKFVEAVRSGPRYKVTEPGKKFLEGEAKLRNMELEKYVAVKNTFSDFLRS